MDDKPWCPPRPPSSDFLRLYVGDDWEIDLAATSDTGGPADFTGCQVSAELFQFPRTTPVQLDPADVSVLDPPAAGLIRVFVDRSITAGCTTESGLRVSHDPLLRTRLHVFFVDADDRRHTVGVVPIIPVRP